MTIWAAGNSDDFKAATESIGEPIITTMAPDETLPPSSKTRSILPTSSHMSAYDLWQLHKAKQELRGEHLDYWRGSAKDTGTGRPVDAIISPVAAYAAPPHGKNRLESFIFSSPSVHGQEEAHFYYQECRLYHSVEHP